jgi:hypothetical protein
MMMGNVTKLNALRRLTMNLHVESPTPRKHKEWRQRRASKAHSITTDTPCSHQLAPSWLAPTMPR